MCPQLFLEKGRAFRAVLLSGHYSTPCIAPGSRFMSVLWFFLPCNICKKGMLSVKLYFVTVCKVFVLFCTALVIRSSGLQVMLYIRRLSNEQTQITFDNIFHWCMYNLGCSFVHLFIVYAFTCQILIAYFLHAKHCAKSWGEKQKDQNEYCCSFHET